jgi:hypothetical protein
MCGFTVDLLDFDQLSEAQKKALLKNLQRKKKALEAELKYVNESLKGTNRALREVEKNLKR